MATRQGTFTGMEQGRFGPRVVISTQKGPWKLDWKGGQLPSIAQGQPVRFEAGKNDRGFWECTAIQPDGGTFQQAGQAAQPQGWHPQTQAVPPPQQPQAQHSTAPQPRPSGASTDCAIFVTGLIGRCLHGTGTFPDLASLRDMVFNAKLAWEIEMEGKPEPQAQQHPNNPGPVPGPEIAGGLQRLSSRGSHNEGPPPGHPAGEAPPLDDQIPW